jgi:hypothetical protein
VLLGACVLGSIGLRLVHIADPPFDFHPARQFRGAIRARSLYWKGIEGLTPRQRELARVSLAATLEKEPAVMEALAVAAYRLTGGERLWLPRALAAVFWGLGALLLFTTTVRLYGRDGALLAPFLFLFLPFAVNVGRAFMPEALMTALFLAAVLAILNDARGPTPGRLAVAAGATAAAVLVKAVAIFPLWGAFLALALRGKRPLAAARDRRAWAFLAASGMPGLVYYGVTMVVSPTLRGVVRSNFIPRLWLTQVFWSGWLTQLGRTTGWTLFALAAVALWRLRDRTARTLLGGLIAGHLAYACVFTYAIATHDYYHTAFFAVALVALGAHGPALSRALSAGASRPRRAAAIVGVSAAAVTILAFAAAAADPGLVPARARSRLAIPAAILCGNQLTSWVSDPPADLQESSARIGEVVGHSVRTVFLAWEYGTPLSYYGRLFGAFWPDARDVWARGLRGVPPMSAEERFEEQYRPLGADYFIVGDMRTWEAQPDLQQLLRSRYAVVSESPSYIVFDLRRSALVGATASP